MVNFLAGLVIFLLGLVIGGVVGFAIGNTEVDE